MELLNKLVDDSDPDTQLSQIEHLLQTAEALRKDQLPEWMILTGLIHDLGKILILFNEPQARNRSILRTRNAVFFYFQVARSLNFINFKSFFSMK